MLKTSIESVELRPLGTNADLLLQNEFFGAPSSALRIKRWNGTAWINISFVKKWNGVEWVDLTTMKKFSGVSWDNI